MSENTEPKCSVCGRHRAADDSDYTPMQAIFGQPFGWFSGDDGEFCPECFTKLFERGNGACS